MKRGLDVKMNEGSLRLLKLILEVHINGNKLHAVLRGKEVPDMQQLAKKNYPAEALLYPNMASQALPVHPS